MEGVEGQRGCWLNTPNTSDITSPARTTPFLIEGPCKGSREFALCGQEGFTLHQGKTKAEPHALCGLAIGACVLLLTNTLMAKKQRNSTRARPTLTASSS